jgi:hypothetical protein
MRAQSRRRKMVPCSSRMQTCDDTLDHTAKVAQRLQIVCYDNMPSVSSEGYQAQSTSQLSRHEHMILDRRILLFTLGYVYSRIEHTFQWLNMFLSVFEASYYQDDCISHAQSALGPRHL